MIPKNFLKNLRRASAKFMGEMVGFHAKKVDGRITPHYSAALMFKRTLCLFFFQIRSINAYSEDDFIRCQVDVPVQRTEAYYLEHCGVTALNDCLWAQAYTAMRGKQLDGIKGSDGKWTMAFDGISLSYSKKRHCDKCLTTTKDGVISYHHALLVAAIVNKAKKFSMVVAVIPIENEPNAGKQACELKASKEMLDHLKEMNPYLRYNITVDGLYLAASFVNQAVVMGHSVTMPLAKETMDIFEILDVRFGNGRPSVQLRTVNTTTTVAYDAENIAPYWDSLNKLNPTIALYGMKRTIVDNKTGEVRECLIVTTLIPTAKNAMRISDIQREKWQEENKTFNLLKNHYHQNHVYNHKAQTQVFIFAAIALNIQAIALLRHPPQKHVKKPLTITSLIKSLFNLCQGQKNLLGIFDVLGAPALSKN